MTEHSKDSGLLSRWRRPRRRALRTRRIATGLALAVALAAPSALPSRAVADASLPTPNAYNTTPACAPFDHIDGGFDWGNYCGPWTVPVDPHNTFVRSFGQCVYWALEKRPDIYADRSHDDDLVSWDAWTWVTHAQREGLDVDGNPRPGDVAVWSQALAGDDTGHVAYVEAVRADGSIIISEYNSRFGTAAGDKTVLTATGLDSWQDLEFIHLTGNVAPLAGNPPQPSQATRPVASQQAKRSMQPSHPHISRRGQRVTLTVTIAAGSGTVDATATRPRAVKTLRSAASSTSSRFVFQAKLAPGRWTLQVRYRPAPGYKAPRPSRLTVSIPGGEEPQR